MATLVHDDLVDGARMRRGAPAAWSVFGPDAALSAGDYLFACAFAELAETGDSAAVEHPRRRLPRARPRRGDAAQPDARPGDDDRRLPRAVRAQDREALRGRVPARLGRRPGARRVRPLARDRVPDRRRHPRLRGPDAGDGKIPGTDLREGTPTMPLLLAAQQDEVVRAALAGGPLDGALVRVAATDALARSREAALDYAARARSFLVSDIAPRGARSPDPRRRRPGELEATDGDRTRHQPRPDPRQGGGGRAARPRGRPRADGVRRPARDRRAGRPRAARAWRRRPRLLRPEPVLEPDERLPREVQVLRLRRDAEAGARLHEDGGRARRGRRPGARADGIHRDPHGERREPARGLRLLRRHDRESSTRRSPTCTSSATRPRRSTT